LFIVVAEILVTVPDLPVAMDEVKVGYLLRQSSVLRRWKRNYFKLYADGNLAWYEGEGTQWEGMEGHINLSTNGKKLKSALECEVAPANGHELGCLLKIEVIEGGSLVVCASSIDEALTWKLMMEQLLGSHVRAADGRLHAVPRRRRIRACDRQQPGERSYRVRSDVYYYPSYGPVQVLYDDYGRPYYVHPRNQVVHVIELDDPYYYRRGDHMFGLENLLIFSWACWLPFLFFAM